MKIVVMNFAGTAGKTTLVANMFKPRMPDASVFSVESINIDSAASGIEAEKMRGKQLGELVDQIMVLDDAIVDVGASNVEDFVKGVQQFSGSHEEFDLFVVPTTKLKKQQEDTVNTIRALRAIGVPKNKIRVVFNKVDLDETVESAFPGILALAELEKSFTLREKAVVYENEVFERMKAAGTSLGAVMADETDYRAQLRTAKDDDEKARCVQMVAIKRLAVTASKNLDDVFAEIMR
ncbi:plasmid stabilization protein [Burkholderia sp. Ac-20345]|uniref:StbB family protein n=1 Tax=Burkholderia sp. Ac-20345 TaxID=2703891 RepID=UPI00197B39B4|nr:StbB family protein [Burkholderia sp. Ac-20345]MBN3780477.1 plasmid stabilization protein [Burkholderia sp. Ac-20345]